MVSMSRAGFADLFEFAMLHTPAVPGSPSPLAFPAPRRLAGTSGRVVPMGSRTRLAFDGTQVYRLLSIQA
jgi:hypothetical protein